MHYVASQTVGDDELVRLCDAHANERGYGVDDYAGGCADSAKCDETQPINLSHCRIEFVDETAFIRLPESLHRPCIGGCTCGRAGCTGKWDTLAIPLTPRLNDTINYSYTVHRPETKA